MYKKLLIACVCVVVYGCGGSSQNEESNPAQPIIQSYEVSASASTGGAITPATQSIQKGKIAVVSITVDEGYEIDSVVGCNGHLNNNVYKTGVIDANCEISANFKLKNYIISSQVPDEGVTIFPLNQTVTYGSNTEFKIEQNTGIGRYEIQGCSGYLVGNTYKIDVVTSDCEITAEFIGNFLDLSLYQNHEDSSIVVSLDLSQTDAPNTELGFVISKENGIDYYDSDNADRNSRGSLRMPVKNKLYQKTIPNLQPDSEYEICMSGINDLRTTGFFGCKKIKTAKKKEEEALIIINHDVETGAKELVDEWISKVEVKYSHVKLKKYYLSSGIIAENLKLYLESEYKSSNLRHVVFIGYDIPALTEKVSNIDTEILTLYSSLSNIERGDWYNQDNSSADEVSIAVIKPQNTTISKYLRRLISFYDGYIDYPKKVLLADAMIASEKKIVRSDFEQYDLSIDMIAGFDTVIKFSDAIRWQDEYSDKLLENKYGLLLLSAHGNSLEHYPCADRCIDYDFIEKAEPKIKLIVAISCNIGQVFANNSPILSYIFGENSGSLSGLASEMLFIDDGRTSRRIISSLKKRKMSIGETSRMFGFVVVGDPFLTFN